MTLQVIAASSVALVQWGLWRAEKHRRRMWMLATCRNGWHALQMPKCVEDISDKQQGALISFPSEGKGSAKDGCWASCSSDDFAEQYSKDRPPASGAPSADIAKGPACQLLPEKEVPLEGFPQPEEGPQCESCPIAQPGEPALAPPLVTAVSPMAPALQPEVEEGTKLETSTCSPGDLLGPSNLDETVKPSAPVDVVTGGEPRPVEGAGQCEAAVQARPRSSTLCGGVQTGCASHTEPDVACGHGGDENEAEDQRTEAVAGGVRDCQPCDCQPCSQHVARGLLPQVALPGVLLAGNQEVGHRPAAPQILQMCTSPATSGDSDGMAAAGQQKSIRKAAEQAQVGFSRSQTKVEKHLQLTNNMRTPASARTSPQALPEMSLLPIAGGVAGEAKLQPASGVLKLDGCSILEGDLADASRRGTGDCLKKAPVPLPMGSSTEIQPVCPACTKRRCEECPMCTCNSMSDCASVGALSSACSVASDGMSEQRPLSVVTVVSRGISSALMYIVRKVVGGGLPPETD